MTVLLFVRQETANEIADFIGGGIQGEGPRIKDAPQRESVQCIELTPMTIIAELFGRFNRVHVNLVFVGVSGKPF